MKRAILWSWTLCLVVVCLGATSVYSQRSAGVAQLEGRLKQDLSSRDKGRISRNFSELYTDAGQSRDEALSKFAAMAERGVADIRVTEFKQFSGTNIASARISITTRGATGAGQETTGFANLIREGGQWKIFGINAFADNQLREGNQLFACPDVPEGFSFEAERGDWPAWPATKVYSVSYRPTQGPTFDKAAWEKRVIDAWTRKAPNQVANYLSSKYVHLGFSKSEVIRGAAELFRKYDSLRMRYRVLDFKYLNSARNLVSYKAVMQLTGVPAGGSQSVTILETLGYGSVIYENGEWKQYSSQFFK